MRIARRDQETLFASGESDQHGIVQGRTGCEAFDVGDVIIWRFGRCFSHGAIYIGGGMIIHSYIGQGVRYERIDAEVFRGRAVKYFTLWK